MVEFLDGERVGAGFRVEQADVVEHGEGAGRDCVGADGGAGVVLDAEAEGDDFEFEAGWGRGEFGGWRGGKMLVLVLLCVIYVRVSELVCTYHRRSRAEKGRAWELGRRRSFRRECRGPERPRRGREEIC